MDVVASEIRERLLGAAIEGSGGTRYHVRELLGEGGQGWVYKANYDEPDGFWVVVKVLRPEGIQSDSLKRFEREAEVLRMLGSAANPNPNIVRFYDYATHVVETTEGELGMPFIALEYVDGQTLSKVLQAHGGFGLPVARVRRVFRQVARALSTVHEHRIVHRDLKPSNILLAQQQGQEVAKVTDFGLVKLPELSAHRTATVAGASLGYAPPEQYEMGNNRVTVQTDVFSFATILFECLAGTEAFPFKPGDNPLRIVARMLSGDRPGLARVSATVPRELRDRPDITAALDREIGRAVSADPAHRHPSIKDFWERVEPLLREAAGREEGRSSGRQPMQSVDDAEPIASAAPSGRVSGERARASGPPVPGRESASPASGVWEWRIAGRAMTGERLRSAVIAADKTIVAAGSHGLYHFARGVWSALHLPTGLDARFIRGLSRLPSGELLLFGDTAFALALAPGGGAERIAVADRDVTLLGAHIQGDAMVFVGERLSRPVGVLLELTRGGPAAVTTLEGTTRLHAVTRLAHDALLACGSHGDLVEIARGERRDVTWGRTGHLYAVTSAENGEAFAVGSGGHALRIAYEPDGEDEPPRATLEAVQTTRDLGFVTLDARGTAWAVGGQARLLARIGHVWTRVPLPADVQGTIVAVLPQPDAVLVLGEDGLVLEARRGL